MFNIILYNFTTNSRKQEYYNKYFSVFGSVGCGREIARTCVYTIYIYIICMFINSAKYVWRQNIEIKPDLTIWLSETSHTTKKLSYRGGTKQLFYFSYVHPYLRIVHILPPPTRFAAYIHVLYGTQKKIVYIYYIIYNNNII